MLPGSYLPAWARVLFVCVCVSSRSLTLDAKCSGKRSTAIKQESERVGEREADEQDQEK